MRILGLITFVLSRFDCLHIRRFVAFRWVPLAFDFSEAVDIPQSFRSLWARPRRLSTQTRASQALVTPARDTAVGPRPKALNLLSRSQLGRRLAPMQPGFFLIFFILFFFIFFHASKAGHWGGMGLPACALAAFCSFLSWHALFWMGPHPVKRASAFVDNALRCTLYFSFYCIPSV